MKINVRAVNHAAMVVVCTVLRMDGIRKVRSKIKPWRKDWLGRRRQLGIVCSAKRPGAIVERIRAVVIQSMARGNLKMCAWLLCQVLRLFMVSIV